MTISETPVFDSINTSRICKDPAVDLLRDLIAEGLPQWEASKIAFGGAPAWDAPPIVHAAWARVMVHRLADDLRRRLRLPARSFTTREP